MFDAEGLLSLNPRYSVLSPIIISAGMSFEFKALSMYALACSISKSSFPFFPRISVLLGVSLLEDVSSSISLLCSSS